MAPPPENVVVVKKKPIQYENLKIILGYMDPNKRFQIANEMPEIRSIHRIVRLKIDTLSFGYLSMTVNRTEYQLGVCLEFHKGIKEKLGMQGIEEKNNNGGTIYDVDPYGLRDYSVVGPATPGDIDFEEQEKSDEFQYQEEPPAILTTEDYQREYNMLRLAPGMSSDFDGVLVRRYLLEYRLKEELPPFDRLIQLTITKPDGKQSIQKGPYTFKLHQAFKNLTSNFFGQPSKSIKIKKLLFDVSYGATSLRIVRLPVGLILKVEKLELEEDMEIPLAMSKLIPIIHNSALRCLVVHSFDENELRYPFIQDNLEKLVIKGVSYGDPVILYPHKNIHLPKWAQSRFDVLIEHWIDVQREIGTSLKLYFMTEKEAMDELKKIKEMDFDFKIEEDRVLTISANRISDIQFKIEEIDPDEDVDPQKTWRLAMEMVASGTAV